MECPVCHNSHEPDDRFCRRCGASLTGEPQQEPQGRFRPLFERSTDPAAPWDNYGRPFIIAALWFCLGLLALAGVVVLIQYLLGSSGP